VVKHGKYTRVIFTKAVVSGWSEAHASYSFEITEEYDGNVTSPSDGQEAPQTDETVSDAIIEHNNPWSAFYAAYGTTQAHHDTWATVLKALSMSMPKSTYEQYIVHTQLLATEDDKAVIGVLHGQSKDWLENRMGNKILKALNGQLAEQVRSIQFVSLQEPNFA
jgi:hypothetical protein